MRRLWCIAAGLGAHQEECNHRPDDLCPFGQIVLSHRRGRAEDQRLGRPPGPEERPSRRSGRALHLVAAARIIPGRI